MIKIIFVGIYIMPCLNHCSFIYVYYRFKTFSPLNATLVIVIFVSLFPAITVWQIYDKVNPCETMLSSGKITSSFNFWLDLLLGPFDATCLLMWLYPQIQDMADYRDCFPFFVLLGGVRIPRAGDGGLRLDNGAGAFSFLCVTTSACYSKRKF